MPTALLEAGDQTMTWGLAKETGLRITGLSVNRKVLNVEKVEDHTGSIVAAGYAGNEVTATISGKIRNTGPAFSLATVCTVANSALFNGYGVTVQIAVCTAANTKSTNKTFSEGDWSFDCYDFAATGDSSDSG